MLLSQENSQAGRQYKRQTDRQAWKHTGEIKLDNSFFSADQTKCTTDIYIYISSNYMDLC
jgi:hypothetical protein